jgi:hypothetical protein
MGSSARGERLGLATVARGLVTLVVVGVIVYAFATPANAYIQLFKPVVGSAPADPCAQEGIGRNGGLVVHTQPDPGKPSVARSVALLCGPRRSIPLSTLLADDQIWQYAMGKEGHTDTHMLQGGQESMPWNAAVTTKHHPFIKGPGGHASGFDPDQIDSQAIQKQMLDLLLEVLPDITAAAVECVLGALETDGEACLELLVTLGAVALIEAGIAAEGLFQVIAQFLERGRDMEQSDWFYWSEGPGFWNGFGDVGGNYINPSITLSDPFASHDSRIGVVFSNVALDQGPDFGLPAGRGRTTRGKHIYGAARNQTLVGSDREDFIKGGARNDVIHGHGGGDILLQGGTGNDRIYGGKGADNIDGYRGRDLLVGDPGNDNIVDVYGPTVVRAGSGRNLVNVHDGRGDDRVNCRGSIRNVVNADRRDRIDRSCRVGRSRVVRGGPRMRIGVGY